MAIPKICIKCVVRPCCSKTCEEAKSDWLRENGVPYETLHDCLDGPQMWLTNTLSEINWSYVFRLPKEEIEEMKILGKTYTTGQDVNLMTFFIICEKERQFEDEAAGVINKEKRRKYGPVEMFVREQMQKCGGYSKWEDKLDAEEREARIQELTMWKNSRQSDLDRLTKEIAEFEQGIQELRMPSDQKEVDREIRELEMWEEKLFDKKARARELMTPERRMEEELKERELWEQEMRKQRMLCEQKIERQRRKQELLDKQKRKKQEMLDKEKTNQNDAQNS